MPRRRDALRADARVSWCANAKCDTGEPPYESGLCADCYWRAERGDLRLLHFRMSAFGAEIIDGEGEIIETIVGGVRQRVIDKVAQWSFLQGNDVEVLDEVQSHG